MFRINRDITNTNGKVVNIEVTFSSGGTEIKITPVENPGRGLILDLTPMEAMTLYDLMTLVRQDNTN